jgi:hypothetical protein
MTQHNRFVRLALALLAIALPLWTNLMASDMSQLESLRKERKFAPTELYTGPDTPEDGPQLIALVDAAIDDILAMPRPLVADIVRRRLAKLIDDVDLFATEDRDQTYTYTIRIWRATGFTEESKLLGVPDESALRSPW